MNQESSELRRQRIRDLVVANAHGAAGMLSHVGRMFENGSVGHEHPLSKVRVTSGRALLREARILLEVAETALGEPDA